MTDRVGQQFGSYRLIQLLSRGGFAEVYLGQHLRLATQQAAIKILIKQLYEEDVRIFEREAETIAALVHPHIVRLLDFDVTNGVPFLVMDYAPNGSLRQRHRKGEQVDLLTVVSYVRQIAEGLQYAHDRRVIHRDVKPDNILIGIHNEILLTDFGIAIAVHSTQSQDSQPVGGTVPYMAPEQIHEYPRPASDQYALGITVYEWLTGTRPFQGSFLEVAAKHALVAPPPLRSFVPTLSPEVERVVLRALEKNPQGRYPSVIEFARALEQVSGVSSVVNAPLHFPAPPRVWRVTPGNEVGSSGETQSPTGDAVNEATMRLNPPSTTPSSPLTPARPFVGSPQTPLPPTADSGWTVPVAPRPAGDESSNSSAGWTMPVAPVSGGDKRGNSSAGWTRSAGEEGNESSPDRTVPVAPFPAGYEGNNNSSGWTMAAGSSGSHLSAPPVISERPQPKRSVNVGLLVLSLVLALLVVGGGIFGFSLLRGGKGGSDNGSQATSQANATSSALAAAVIAANGGKVLMIKIGATLPVKVSTGEMGVQAENGARMALNEALAAHFLPGYNLELDLHDYSLSGLPDPATGQKDVSNMIGDAQIAAILGPLDSDVAIAEMPLTNRAPIVQVSPSTTATCLTQNSAQTVCIGNTDELPRVRPTGKVNYFRLSTTNNQEGAAGAEFAAQTLHSKSAFIIDDISTYGVGEAKMFIQQFQANGGTVLGNDHLAARSDYRQELATIAGLKPDVIFFAGRDSTGGVAFRQQMLQTKGLQNTPLIGGDGIRTSLFAGSAVTGGGPTYGAVVNVDIKKISPQFVQHYRVAGYGSAGGFSASSYDSTWIVLNAIKAALQAGAKPPVDANDVSTATAFRQSVIDQVAHTSYMGATGVQSFDINGDTTNKNVSIYQLVIDTNGVASWQYVLSENL